MKIQHVIAKFVVPQPRPQQYWQNIKGNEKLIIEKLIINT